MQKKHQPVMCHSRWVNTCFAGGRERASFARPCTPRAARARRMMVNASAKPYLSVRVEPGEKPLDVLGEALAHLEAAKMASCEEM